MIRSSTKMKVKEIMKIIEQDGWFMLRIKESHRQYRQKNKNGLVTIAGNIALLASKFFGKLSLGQSL